MFGRVRMYNLGFAIFSVASIFLTVTWQHGTAGALWLIGWRIVQGIGGAFLFANSTAILTDAFPANQRGTALGINSIAAIAGSFLGLLLGGVLGPINWHLVFLVSAPIGLFGTVWAYFMLRDIGDAQARPDGLVGQHLVRHRAGRDPGRHHLWPAALRRAPDGLDQPVGADRHLRRDRATGGVRRRGDQGRRAAVPAVAVPASAPSPGATSPT